MMDPSLEILEELRRIRRAVERPPAPRLLTVAELAEALNASESYIYAHREQLGALRLPSSSGAKERLRFDLDQVRARLGAAPPKEIRPQAAPRRRNRSRGKLKIRGERPE